MVVRSRLLLVFVFVSDLPILPNYTSLITGLDSYYPYPWDMTEAALDNRYYTRDTVLHIERDVPLVIRFYFRFFRIAFS